MRTAAGGHIAVAVIPAIVGLLAAFIAYERQLPARDHDNTLVAAGDAA